MSCTESPPEESFVRDRREGSARLEALYRQHGDALRQLCRRRLGNDRDAEDAAQEALLRAWGALDGVDPGRPIWPWLATIASNVCIDLQRRARTAERRRPPCEPAPVSPEEHALSGDRDALVREALGTLPRSSQQVLFLRDVEGWSYGSIGLAEGRSAPAVRVAVTRARHQLRAQVEVMARATGRWPLAAVSVLSARTSSMWRRVRFGGSQLPARCASWTDASVSVAALSSSVAAQTVCGALMLASVGAIPGFAWGPDPAPDRGAVVTAQHDTVAADVGSPERPRLVGTSPGPSGEAGSAGLLEGQGTVPELDVAIPAPTAVGVPAQPSPQVVAVPPSPPSVSSVPVPEVSSPPPLEGSLLVSSIG